MSENNLDNEIAAAREHLRELEARRQAQRAAEPATGDAVPFMVTKAKSKPQRQIPALYRNLAIAGVTLGTFGVLYLLVGLGAASEATSEVYDTAPVASEPAPPKWEYKRTTDAMTDGVTRVACMEASEPVRLSWPYEAQSPRLCVRKSPRHGTDAFVMLPLGGQFLCRTGSGCTARVRFDDGAAVSYGANEAADNSPNVIFLRSPQKFIAALREAKQVRIEATFYQDGTQVMTFNAEPYIDDYLDRKD